MIQKVAQSMATGKGSKAVSYIVILLLVLLVSYFTLKGIGLVGRKKTKEDKEFEKEIADNILLITKAPSDIRKNSYLNPDKWRQGPSNKLAPKPEVIEYASKLKYALNKWWGDDEQLVYGTFTKIPNLWVVSQVADAYRELTDGSLRDKMLDDLNHEELARVNSILSGLSV